MNEILDSFVHFPRKIKMNLTNEKREYKTNATFM